MLNWRELLLAGVGLGAVLALNRTGKGYESWYARELITGVAVVAYSMLGVSLYFRKLNGAK